MFCILEWFLYFSVKDRVAAATAAKLLQLCPTLCDPIDGSPPGSPVPGILQARTLEWGAISFSNAWKWKVKVKSLSRVRLLATPWTAPHQAPPPLGFSRQEYWSGVPLPSPGRDTIQPITLDLEPKTAQSNKISHWENGDILTTQPLASRLPASTNRTRGWRKRHSEHPHVSGCHYTHNLKSWKL